MKTKLLLAILFTLTGYLAGAQTFGVKGGINFSNITGFENSSISSLTGFHLGGVAEFDLKQNLYLNTGLLYSLKGFSIKEEGGKTGKEKLSYLEVPLNVAYKFPVKDKTKIFIQAGPYLGYGLSYTEKSGGESHTGSFKDGGIKSFDFGIGFGGGVEVGPFVAGINYELGLTNIIDMPESDMTWKNSVFQISLAYMFPKK